MDAPFEVATLSASAPRSLKIALVTDRLDPRTGGLAIWTLQFAGFLAARGHDVHILAFAGTVAPHGVAVHLVSEDGSIFDRAARIDERLRDLAADVVHDTGTGWSADVFQPQTGSRLLAFQNESRGLAMLQRARALLHPRALWWQICLARLERRQLRNARRVIAVSHRVQHVLQHRFGVDPSGMVVIHNGIDTERFRPDQLAARRAAARAAWALVDEAVLFVVVAHNFHLKNLDTVLEALSVLRQKGHAARLAVAGGVPDAYWQARVERLGVADIVIFCGQVDDILGVLAAADAMVHPTRWDACSLATLEAMACGCPVITTQANGSADAIEDGVSGYVLPDPHDVGMLARRMTALLDAAHRERIGQASRAASLAFDSFSKFAEVEAVLAETAMRPTG